MKKVCRVIVALLICILCVGCGDNKSGQTAAERQTVSGDAEIEKATEKDQEPHRKLTIPKTQKEHDELFGTTDENGNFIPPEGAYTDPKTGSILNREGTVIGHDRRVYDPSQAIGAVG